MGPDETAPPHEVRAAFGLEAATFTPVAIGLINQTFRVDVGGTPRFALQRLHPIFGAEVNRDIDTITRHVAARGVATPRLVPTLGGALWFEHQGVWRVLTWIEGRVVQRLDGAFAAWAAGEMLGRFHQAVADSTHVFEHVRAAVHDTPRHLARLEEALGLAPTQIAHAADRALLDRVRAAGERILGHARALPPLPSTPLRIVHGDPKISNIVFDDALRRGIALLDLDTMAHGSMPVELGDAIRSWVNPQGEDSTAPQPRTDLFEAALVGYAAGAPGLLDLDEIDAIALGAATIALELASRFATDAVEDRYFGWDPSRYASRREHNLARAESQAALGVALAARRGRLEALARGALRH